MSKGVSGQRQAGAGFISSGKGIGMCSLRIDGSNYGSGNSYLSDSSSVGQNSGEDQFQQQIEALLEQMLEMLQQMMQQNNSSSDSGGSGSPSVGSGGGSAPSIPYNPPPQPKPAAQSSHQPAQSSGGNGGGGQSSQASNPDSGYIQKRQPANNSQQSQPSSQSSNWGNNSGSGTSNSNSSSGTTNNSGSTNNNNTTSKSGGHNTSGQSTSSTTQSTTQSTTSSTSSTTTTTTTQPSDKGQSSTTTTTNNSGQKNGDIDLNQNGGTNYGAQTYSGSSKLEANKETVDAALTQAGASPETKAIVQSMMMQETQDGEASQRDASKDGTSSANYSAFNLSAGMLDWLGYKGSPESANDQSNLGAVATALANGIESKGLDNVLNYTRGGQTALQDGTSYDAANYRATMKATAQLLVQTPDNMVNSFRVAANTPHV